MGFMLGKANQVTLDTFDTTKQDIKTTYFRNNERSLDKTLMTYRFKQKAEFSYELNYLLDADYLKLLKIMQDFSTIREGMFLLPIPESENYSKCILYRNSDYGLSKAYLNYNFTAPIYKPWENNLNTVLGNVYGTLEFDGNQYAAISDYNNDGVFNAGIVSKLKYFVYEFDLSEYISAFGDGTIKRLTLQHSGMLSKDIGFYVWSPLRTKWISLCDEYFYTVADESFETTQNKLTVASCGVPNGERDIYSSLIDSTTKKIYFMVSQKTVYAGIAVNFVRLFVNGYYVNSDDATDFENFTVSFTGAGRSGQLKLSEI